MSGGADETDVEDVLNSWEQSNAQRGKYKRSDDGSDTIFLLPPTVRGKFYTEFGVHYGLTELNANVPEDLNTILCPTLVPLDLRQMLGLPDDCFACKVVRQGKQSANNPDGSQNRAKWKHYHDHGRRKRYVCNVLVAQKLDEGVLTWEFGPSVLGDVLVPIFRLYKKITSPTEGQWLVVKWTKARDGESNREWVKPVSATPMPEACGLTKLKNLDWRAGRKDLEQYIMSRYVPNEKLEELLTKRSGGGRPATAATQEAGSVAGRGSVEPEDAIPDSYDDADDITGAGPAKTRLMDTTGVAGEDPVESVAGSAPKAAPSAVTETPPAGDGSDAPYLQNPEVRALLDSLKAEAAKSKAAWPTK